MNNSAADRRSPLGLFPGPLAPGLAEAQKQFTAASQELESKVKIWSVVVIASVVLLLAARLSCS